MIGRLLVLSVIPIWAWVLLTAVTGIFAVVILMVLIVGGTTSSIASNLHYQCDSAVGPDPAQTATPSRTSPAGQPTARSATGAGESAVPTTNPFAELTIAPDDARASDWQRACVTALKTAPYQAQPLLTGSSGIDVECARDLALARVSASAGGAENGTDLRADAAEFTRSVIYRASAARSTGQCELTAVAAAPLPTGAAGQQNDSARRGCGQLAGTGAEVIILPISIAAQGACGQRVDSSAVSAGDLVFWDYRNNAPARAGIAVSAGRLVTSDPATGRYVELAIPSTSDVRVKRVLGSGM